MHLPITEHARTRMQQRGIPPAALELLLDFGRETHDHRGCRIVRFDKRSRRLVLNEIGRERYRAIERCLDAYAVVANDDAIVTVGHRIRCSSPRARQSAQWPGAQ